MINPKIIREYDIRGIYNQTLTIKDAYLVGLSFAKYLSDSFPGPHTVNVCRDGRLSSPLLFQHLISGLIKGGMKVCNLGIGPTPLLYFSNFNSDSTAGIMITGSHNPANYNGFKFIVKQKPFFGDKIKNLQTISQQLDESAIILSEPTSTNSNFFEQYVNLLISTYSSSCQMKVVWDCGNGATGAIVKALTKELPGHHILLNEIIDGTFPAHHPDPTVLENIQQLKEAVIKHRADIGIAFDGDGDRIGVIDNKGRVVWGDQILSILAHDILKRHPGAAIIADVKASQVLFDQIAKDGGKPVMWKTGHSHIKDKMLELNSPLAGEMSGHIFIADNYYGYDDAIYTAIRLISSLTERNLSITQAYDALPKVCNTTEIRVQCDDDKKFVVISALVQYFQQQHIPFDDVDGIRFSFPNGWGLIRASNTQDVLVCRFEALSEEVIRDKFDWVASLLATHSLAMDRALLIINS